MSENKNYLKKYTWKFIGLNDEQHWLQCKYYVTTSQVNAGYIYIFNCGATIERILSALTNFESHCMILSAIANNLNFIILFWQKITDENVKFEKYNGIK